MTYAQFGLIQPADFNNLIGNASTANTLNATWGVGTGAAGYGQTEITAVSVGDTVVAAGKWNSLVSNTASAATHQGSSITSITAPVAGSTITHFSALPTNLTTIYTNRLNAAAQGSTTANTVTFGSTWSALLTVTHTASFANSNAARYFFNSGGQLAMTVSHANTTAGINLLFNQLCSNVGTVVLSSPSSGTVSVAGTSYNGVTKIGGGGNAPTISTNSGYYALTSSNTTVFTQTASTGPSGYLGTFIRFIAKLNATQGNVVTIYTVWDEIPDGLTVGTGATTTLTVRPPSTTNISNSWGTITLTGSASGS